MKFLNYINEIKQLQSTMIGLSIDNNIIIKQYNYIKSWLIKYNISFSDIEDKHISIAMIKEKVNKDDIIRFINDISKKDITFKFKSYNILEGRDWDFIVLEFKRNPVFLEILNKTNNLFDIIKFKDGVRPHISLLKTEKNKISKDLFNTMIENAPDLKTIKTKKIQLWNNKFNIEFVKKMK